MKSNNLRCITFYITVAMFATATYAEDRCNIHICHSPAGKVAKSKAIAVAPSSANAHMAHGDFICSGDPCATSLLMPGDPILAIDRDGGSSSPALEEVENAIDGSSDKKYLNFGGPNSGFIVSPSLGATVVGAFQITTANDDAGRDPSKWELYGTNDPITSPDHGQGLNENWTLIASGSVTLPNSRFTQGDMVTFSNTTSYTSYRMVFTELKSSSTMQIGEIQFFRVCQEK